MDWGHVITLFVVLIFSLTFHEAAHGLVAKLGGDPTAWNAGLMTLNPVPHMRREPFGMLVIPIVILYLSAGRYCFGGASAPIDGLWAARHPRKAALMSFAGPLANLVLATIGFAIMFLIARPDPKVDWQGTTFDTAHVVFSLNLILALFNLLPLPPFDGAGVVGGLSAAMQRLYDSYARIPMYSIISMLIAWQLLPYVFFP
ncbi:MAG: site-2 protease family protein, partial [Planctomycetes bacterium]|nr:site-2 protease family protein [Planctomycetota bacterium]